MKLEKLEEFVNLLKSPDLAFVETECVSNQILLIGHLSSLLNQNRVTDKRNNDNLFVIPRVELFLTKLIINLDSKLKPQARDLYQHGLTYVACFIGNHNAQYVVRRLLKVLEERFPNLKDLHTKQFEDFIATFFQLTIGEFLNENKDSLKELSKAFPAVYQLFMEPLTGSSFYKDRKLFNYFCNPCIYNSILDFLVKQDDSEKFSVLDKK